MDVRACGPSSQHLPTRRCVSPSETDCTCGGQDTCFTSCGAPDSTLQKSGVPMSLTGCLSPLLTEDMGWGGGLPCPHSPSSQPQIVAWEVGGGACQQHELRPNQLTNYECQKNRGGNRGCSAAARNKQHCFPASWEAQVQEPHRD